LQICCGAWVDRTHGSAWSRRPSLNGVVIVDIVFQDGNVLYCRRLMCWTRLEWAAASGFQSQSGQSQRVKWGPKPVNSSCTAASMLGIQKTLTSAVRTTRAPCRSAGSADGTSHGRHTAAAFPHTPGHSIQDTQCCCATKAIC
jgi:hypothetical protein